MKKLVLLFTFSFLLVTSVTAQTLIASWTFDDTPGAPNTPTSVLATLGSQTGTAGLYADGTNGSSAWIADSTGGLPLELNAFTGNTLNDPRGAGAIAGYSYCPVNQTANGKSMILKLSMTGYQNLILSFATRGTSTGFNSQQWAWSTDGTTFTDFGSNTAINTSTWTLQTLDLTTISDLNNATDVYLRVSFDGASSATGNNRLDNIQINATEITSTPTLTVDPTILTGFTYVEGAGPSTSQSYTLSGSDLTPSDSLITVAGSTNYEVSADNVTFSDTVKVDYTGGALADTTIYVRLKAGLTIGDYNNEVISNVGGGATEQDVTVDGSVTSVPVLSGDYYIPQGSNSQGFATLEEAVTALNLGGASGTVNFLLDADTLRENSITFTATLSTTNNVVVKPAPGRDVVMFVKGGASKGNGVQMIGFDKGHVTFDGSNNGTNTRNLIVSTEDDAVAVPFGLNTSDADTVVLKNMVIKNFDNVITNFRYGAVINDKNDVWGFQVENCQIGTAERPVRRDGLAPWGTSAPNQFSFVNNEIYCGTRGVTSLYLTKSNIIGNTINILPTTAAATDAYNHGIYITGATDTINIKGNTVNCLEETINPSSYLIGIAFAGNGNAETDVINVVNNMVNVGAADETRDIYGIGLRSANPMGNLKVYYNTILINDHSSTLVSYGIGNRTTNGTGPVDIDLKDNIIINNHTGNTTSAAIGIIPATSVLSSNYNDLLAADTVLVNYQGTTYADLFSWQATMQDLNSVSVPVDFVSGTDLHLAGSSNGDTDLAGIPITGITTDIDGDTRSASYPYMGADEASKILAPFVTIAEARKDDNHDLIPDYKVSGDILKITGVITSPNFSTTSTALFIQDQTAGIEIFAYHLLPTTEFTLGDSVFVIGKVDQYRGLDEFAPLTLDSTNFGLIKHNAVIPEPKKLTLHEFSANPENYEGLLIEVDTLYQVSGTWPTATNNGYIDVRNASKTDTVLMFISSYTDIPGSTEPQYPITLTGIGQQYSSGTSVLDDGYEITPRYTTDIRFNGVTGVDNSKTQVITYQLDQNYPNPFNPTTVIRYSIPVESKVTIAVYSITGELVKELVNSNMSAGSYSVNFDGSRLASGVYIYRIIAGKFMETKKMMLLK